MTSELTMAPIEGKCPSKLRDFGSLTPNQKPTHPPPLCLDNLWNKVGLSSSRGPGVLDVSFNYLRTCWRHTWTASCTLTKYHSSPISKTPALDKVRRTSRFGLEMAICKDPNAANNIIGTFGTLDKNYDKNSNFYYWDFLFIFI